MKLSLIPLKFEYKNSYVTYQKKKSENENNFPFSSFEASFALKNQIIFTARKRKKPLRENDLKKSIEKYNLNIKLSSLRSILEPQSLIDKKFNNIVSSGASFSNLVLKTYLLKKFSK